MLRHLRARAAAAALLLAACSTLPPAALPPHRDHHVAAEFVVPDDGRLPLPPSSPTLSMRELQLDPPPLAERFANARRWFVYAPGTHVRVRARFRTWADADGPPADAAAVLGGARRVTALAP